jgi:hypothetical protein
MNFRGLRLRLSALLFGAGIIVLLAGCVNLDVDLALNSKAEATAGAMSGAWSDRSRTLVSLGSIVFEDSVRSFKVFSEQLWSRSRGSGDLEIHSV